MNELPKKKLRMRRLTRKEIGSYRMTLISALADSPDPYASVLYSIAIDKCRELAQSTSARAGKKITLTPVINKMLAVAIAENPIFNQFILGGGMYEMEGIHIANVVMLPGDDQAVTFLILENSHLKSLLDIQDEFRIQKEQLTKSYMRQQNGFAYLLARLYFKTRLYRLVSEKLSFTFGFQKGLTSNILLSNHVYNEPGNFIVLKPVIASNTISLRIHACGTRSEPFMEEGRLTTKEIMPISMAIDHRIIWGIHVQQFGESLKRIAADPEKYLA